MTNDSLVSIINALDSFGLTKGKDCNINDFMEFSAHLRVSDVNEVELMVFDTTRDIIRKSRKGYRFTLIPTKQDTLWGICVEEWNCNLFTWVHMSNMSRLVPKCIDIKGNPESFEITVERLFPRKIAYFLNKGIRAMLCEMKTSVK